jgi:hypothetical protein
LTTHRRAFYFPQSLITTWNAWFLGAGGGGASSACWGWDERVMCDNTREGKSAACIKIICNDHR